MQVWIFSPTPLRFSIRYSFDYLWHEVILPVIMGIILHHVWLQSEHLVFTFPTASCCIHDFFFQPRGFIRCWLQPQNNETELGKRRLSAHLPVHPWTSFQMSSSLMVGWEVRLLRAGNAEKVVPHLWPACSRSASQQQREKRQVLPTGRVHVKVHIEMISHVLTNTDRGEKRQQAARGKGGHKDEACLKGAVCCWRCHPNGRGLPPVAEVAMVAEHTVLHGNALRAGWLSIPSGPAMGIPAPSFRESKGAVLLIKHHHSPTGERLLKCQAFALICCTSSFPNLSRTQKLATW